MVVVGVMIAAVGAVVASPATAVAETAPSLFVPVRPCRLLDSRESPGRPLNATTTAEVRVAGRCGVGKGAVAAALTLTVIEPDQSGYATLFPTGSKRPIASALNYASGETIANMQLVQIGSGGNVSVYSLRTGHFVVDVTGYFVPADGGSSRAGRYVPIDAYRAVDTRETRRPAPRSVVSVRPDVPSGAIAVAVTITTTGTRGPGFFAAYAAGERLPVASVLNADAAGQTRSASAIVPVSSSGFEVYTQAGDHVIVDVTGYFSGPGAKRSTAGLFVSTTPTRLVDTRPWASPSWGPRLWDRGTRDFRVTGITGGPVGAVAANFTVTETEDSGYLLAYPARTRRPLESTVNYDSGAATVATSSIVRTSTAGIATYALEATHLVVDITGWFTGSPVATTTGAPTNDPPADRHVVIIGDSAMAGLRWNGTLDGLRGFVPSAAPRIVSAPRAAVVPRSGRLFTAHGGRRNPCAPSGRTRGHSGRGDRLQRLEHQVLCRLRRRRRPCACQGVPSHRLGRLSIERGLHGPEQWRDAVELCRNESDPRREDRRRSISRGAALAVRSVHETLDRLVLRRRGASDDVGVVGGG